MKDIKILGTGCPKCKTLTSLVEEVVADNGIAANVEKIEDIMEIMQYNVMSTPAMVVDGEVVVKGRVPSKVELLGMIDARDIDDKNVDSKNSCCQ